MRQGWSRIFQWLSRKCSSRRGVGRKVKVWVGVIVVIGWGPSFISVLMIGLQHLASQARPLLLSYHPSLMPLVSSCGPGGVFPLDLRPPACLLSSTGEGFDASTLGLASDAHSRFTVDFPTKNSHIFSVCSSAWSQTEQGAWRTLIGTGWNDTWFCPEPDVRLGSWQGIIHR